MTEQMDSSNKVHQLDVGPRKRPRTGRKILEATMVHAEFEAGTSGIEMAFEIPREVFEMVWKDYGREWSGAIILTIPTDDRVASILHTVPRDTSMEIGERYNLPLIRLPTSEL